MTTQIMNVAGVDLELLEQGSGSPLLLLHGAQGMSPDQPYVRSLGDRRRLIAPSHPGFGKSSLPPWLDHVDDVAHIYLELMDRLGLLQTDVVGCSIGGWIAAEMATKAPDRFKRIVLVGPVGVKVGPPDKLDIPDIFAMPQDRLHRLLFHDADKWRIDPSRMSDEEIATLARNRETLALLVWEPYMHNPKLKHRLHRVKNSALFLRGEHDGLISAEYLGKYAALVPNAVADVIRSAGHVPQVEQPEAFVDAVLSFLDR